eukprot:237451_1
MSCASTESMSVMDLLSVEIERYYTSTRPYAEEVIEKDRLCSYIVECGKYLQTQCEQDGKECDVMTKRHHYSRAWDIFRFGSESWGTSCRDSDIDMGIFVNFRNVRPDKTYLLSQLARIISENDSEGLLLIKPLLNARYPIIRIFENRLNVKIDVSIADRFCRGRDELILSMIKALESKYQIAIKKLIVFIKYWSKQKGINNAYQCYLNSFGYTLLVIKFIQFHLFYEKQSNKSLSFLVYKCFEFYACRFKPQMHSICIQMNDDEMRNIFDAKSFNHEMNSYCFLEIRDPINPENNVAQRVGLSQMLRIKQEFINAFEVIKAYKNDQYSKISLFDLLVQKNGNVMLNYQYLHQFHDEAQDQDWRDKIYAEYERTHQQNITEYEQVEEEEEEEDDDDEEDNETEALSNESVASYNYDAYDGLIDNGYNYNYYNVPYHKSPFKPNNDHRYHHSNTRRRRKQYRSVYVV